MIFLLLYSISKQAYSSTRTFFITNFNIFKYFNFSNLQSNYAISKHLTTLGSDLVVLVARYKLIFFYNHLKCYQMEQNPRGICLIINNEHFYDQNNVENVEMRRYGTDMDASRLKNLFEKLNFQVEMFVDLREIEMRRVLTQRGN